MPATFVRHGAGGVTISVMITNTKNSIISVSKAFAFGALAIGATAVGAMAVGAFAIGKLGIGKGRIEKLDIGELTVDRLVVRSRSSAETD